MTKTAKMPTDLNQRAKAMHYNFARPQQRLGKRVTPAMAAGIERAPWSTTQIAGLLD